MKQPDNRYRVEVIPMVGWTPPADYPRYVHVFGNTIADAVSEARAYLKLNGCDPVKFELRVGRVK